MSDHSLSCSSRRPVLAFLIRHPTHGNVLFDLSLFEEWQDWLGERGPGFQDEFQVEISPEGNLVEQLRKAGVDPEQIDVVILSRELVAMS